MPRDANSKPVKEIGKVNEELRSSFGYKRSFSIYENLKLSKAI